MATRHFPKYSIVDGDVKASINLDRFSEQYQRAQYELDGDVMASMVPFMPMGTGMFVDTTRAASSAIQGSGKVYAAFGVQGRFLYEGKGMVSPTTGSPFAKKGEKKVLVSQYGGKTRAKEFLSYDRTKHPRAQSHWFEAAKQADEDKWIEKVKRIAGGGVHG